MTDPVFVSIGALLLDEENPRLSEPNQGQHATLCAMARLQSSRLKVLAADIAEHGLDPSDLFIVIG